MESSIFGSYSLTEFIDLYDLNIRSNHAHAVFIEVDHDGIVKLSHGKIDNIKKKDNNSYLIGILTDNISKLDIGHESLKFFETPHDTDDINYLMNTKKKFVHLTYENGKVTYISTKHSNLYISENHSFSTTQPNGYLTSKANYIYSIPLFKSKKFITEELK